MTDAAPAFFGADRSFVESRRPETGTRQVAVIDIGSSAIRMLILEVNEDGTYRRLDRANKPIRLGQDVFTTGVIERSTVLQALNILIGFVELMNGWGVHPDDVYAIATNAIREARNRDTFLDRVYRKTGLRVRVIEGVEENHLTFIAIQFAMENMQSSFSRANSLILEVGGGSVELMILKRGKMAATHSLKMGIIRLEQQMAQGMDSEYPLEEHMREQFRVAMANIDTETNIGRIRYFIMVGGDARIVAHQIGKKEGDSYWVLPRSEFLAFVESLQGYSADELVHRLSIGYHEAEGLLPALLIHKIFLEETEADTIIIPNVSIREGVLLRYAHGGDRKLDDQFMEQVIASARSLGRKYRYDEAHSETVTKLSLDLFDQMTGEHGMSRRDRLYLYVAGILHDIGYFISASGHHKHGQYIVQNSEIFGLSGDETKIIAAIVRYHRGTNPNRSHTEFAALTREERLTVLKLTAILRVADALDRSHAQRIGSLDTRIRDEDFVIFVEEFGDLSPERFGLESKGKLFEEVFGYRVVLEQKQIIEVK